MNLKENKHIIISFVGTILCMLAIFILSAQPATESDNNSKNVVHKIVDSTVKLGGEDITEQQKIDLVERVNPIARELMHSVVYFVLGVFAHITILGLRKKYLSAGIITFIFCVAYGLSDEIHQLFVPGRCFQLIDLGMDAIGSLAAIALVMLLYIIKRKKIIAAK
ncbi:MAG TPA: VanZ family protein [Clostridia bacterium]